MNVPNVRLLLLTASLSTLPWASGAAFAQEAGREGGLEASEGGEAEEEPGFFGTMEEFVDETQREASDRLIDFVSSVDGFIGEDAESPEGNESWARIRLEASQPGDEELDFDAKVKLRVVLPQSERRFRLLVSSDDEEEEGTVIRGEEAITSEQADPVSEENASLALRFIRTARDTGSVNFDIGVRQTDGAVQTFGRVKASAEGEMVRRWDGKVSNTYYYYSKSGYRNSLRFSALRPIVQSRNFFFQVATGFSWRKGRKGASIGQSAGFYAEPNERTAIALELLAAYSTSLNGSQSARFGGTEARIRWRHNVWRPWFHYEVWPSVAWPSSNGYERVWGGLLRVEVTIGGRS